MCVAATQEGDLKNDHISKLFIELRKFNNIFSNNQINVLSAFKQENYVIKIENEKKLFYKLFYNLFQTKLSKFRRYLKDSFQKNWIRYSIFSAEAPILFMSKKNNELRLYIDYRDLNAIIIKNRHSLSLISETLNHLYELKIFIKLNFKNAYHRFRIKINNEWKTTFRTRYDYFEYLIISFNLVNTSTTFQTYINKILINLINVTYVVYLNDILIYNVESTNH